jgi:glutamate-1-semialdehyde 2,1-aminomutase
MGQIEERYRNATAKSAELAARANAVMPGGDTRTTTYHAPYPLAIARGEGPLLWDVDGNRYIDLLGNYTSLVHGHAYPPIVEAINRQARDGTAWPARSRPQIELAELLCDRVASIERVRFCNSGTEAGMLAAHVARHITKRKMLLMARFGYHGSYDDLEVGLSGRDGERTILANYGDIHPFERSLAERGDEIAAVFLEPVMGSAGIVSPPEGFLGAIADAAHRTGALFVLDEVITLRLSAGGAQALSGIRPDLTMMGKIIGGGLPVGALAGSAAIMDNFDPRNRSAIWHSGTFNGNPVTCAAGVVSVRELTAERIATMERLARKLAADLRDAARKHGLPFSVRQAGSLLNVFFLNEPPTPAVSRADSRAIRLFHLAALTRGLFLAPRGLIALSTVVGDKLIAEASERAAQAMADVAGELG